MGGMGSTASLQENQKLVVIYRVEPGCLGPEGDSLVDDFCNFAQSKFQDFNTDCIVWHIVPRKDKAIPEMEYNVADKKLNHIQAEKYLAVFGKELDELEGHLSGTLTSLINEFMGR